MQTLTGKVALVTGGNSGLGKATAIGLARLGAHVIIVCRNPEKGAAALAEIKQASRNVNVDLMLADLASQQSIRELSQQIHAQYPKLHLLINNAGGSFPTRRTSPDGIEYSLALNHLASFLLTNLLLDLLKANAPARIINVGTRINTAMDFEDLQFEKRPYGGLRAYSQSKLGNLHFTFELARRLEGSGVTVNCVHPGVFKSNLGKDEGTEPLFFKVIGWIGKVILPDASHAAERILYLAASPEVEGVSGKYFADKQEIDPPTQPSDPAANQQLWAISEQLTRLGR